MIKNYEAIKIGSAMARTNSMSTLVKAPIGVIKEWSKLNQQFREVCSDCIDVKHISLEDQSRIKGILSGFTALNERYPLGGPNDGQTLLAGLEQCTVEMKQSNEQGSGRYE